MMTMFDVGSKCSKMGMLDEDENVCGWYSGGRMEKTE